MIAIFASNTAVLLGAAVVFALLIAAVIGLDSERGRALMRRFVWFRRLELLSPSELRYRGLISVGFGICCFAALLTLKLFEPVPLWSALTLGLMAVVAVTLGAAFLERAAMLDR